MPTLTQIGDMIANNLRQPFNHELKERAKDYVKQELAMYIRRSTKEHGLDEALMVAYDAEVIRVDKYNKPITEEVEGYKLRTKYRVPTSVRFKNDSMFTFVGDIDERVSYPFRNVFEASIMHSFSSTGGSHTVRYDNGYIYVNDTPHNRFKAKYIRIKSIFENPEEVLAMYEDVDGQDIQLPIPIDMIPLFIDKVIQRLGIMPAKDISVEQSKEGTTNER